MSNGRRSKGGGLGPSNAAAAPRGVLLIVVAVALGVLLLWKGLGASEFAVAPNAGRNSNHHHGGCHHRHDGWPRGTDRDGH